MWLGMTNSIFNASGGQLLGLARPWHGIAIGQGMGSAGGEDNQDWQDMIRYSMPWYRLAQQDGRAWKWFCGNWGLRLPSNEVTVSCLRGPSLHIKHVRSPRGGRGTVTLLTCSATRASTTSRTVSRMRLVNENLQILERYVLYSLILTYSTP